jgi:DNA polymerase-1
LEWDSSKGAPPVPLLKDRYANERKKAKVMNFSIAYGKTVHGFMSDWNCTMEEAQATVDLWYKDRPEVKAWQKRVKEIALEKGWTQTLLGRYRNLTKHFQN